MPDVLDDHVEHRGPRLHHPRVVLAVGGVQRHEDLARVPRDEAPGDLGAEERRVRGQVVDDDVPQREVVEHAADLAVREGIAAAAQPHRAQSGAGELVDESADVLERELVGRADVLLVAEVAGDVAAVRQVELEVRGPGRRAAVLDGVDDRALARLVDLRPAVRSPAAGGKGHAWLFLASASLAGCRAASAVAASGVVSWTAPNVFAARATSAPSARS